MEFVDWHWIKWKVCTHARCCFFSKCFDLLKIFIKIYVSKEQRSYHAHVQLKHTTLVIEKCWNKKRIRFSIEQSNLSDIVYTKISHTKIVCARCVCVVLPLRSLSGECVKACEHSCHQCMSKYIKRISMFSLCMFCALEFSLTFYYATVRFDAKEYEN